MYLWLSNQHLCVHLCVHLELLIKAVNLILGNDVAGAWMWPDTQTFDEPPHEATETYLDNNRFFTLPSQWVSIFNWCITLTADDTVTFDSQKSNVKFNVSLSAELWCVSHAELMKGQSETWYWCLRRKEGIHDVFYNMMHWWGGGCLIWSICWWVCG